MKRNPNILWNLHSIGATRRISEEGQGSISSRGNYSNWFWAGISRFYVDIMSKDHHRLWCCWLSQWEHFLLLFAFSPLAIERERSLWSCTYTVLEKQLLVTYPNFMTSFNFWDAFKLSKNYPRIFANCRTHILTFW